MTETTTQYWNSFYGGRDKPVPNIPSQFAVFTAGEIPSGVTVVDIGCGTGRDSMFFAGLGFNVLGVDGSTSAVELCTSTAAARGLSNAKFVACAVEDSNLANAISSAVQGPLVVYARFFIHAITTEQELAFWDSISRLADLGIVAIEFRTDRDAQQAKVTPSHYRRFVPPMEFLARAQNAGFRTMYFTEGFGFAKFKQDDAHVARILLAK